eukprot:scaffold18950_cov122-Isochrysis_galbana.AAC.3
MAPPSCTSTGSASTDRRGAAVPGSYPAPVGSGPRDGTKAPPPDAFCKAANRSLIDAMAR